MLGYLIIVLFFGLNEVFNERASSKGQKTSKKKYIKVVKVIPSAFGNPVHKTLNLIADQAQISNITQVTLINSEIQKKKLNIVFFI